MGLHATLAESAKDILELARHAPSVHNTQPWKVHINGQTIEIELDQNHTLHDGDPTGRETIISLGIFSEALIISAKHLGFKHQSIIFRDRSVVITFQKKQDLPTSNEVVELLQKRCSDRSIYKPSKVTPAMAASLQNASHEDGVKIWVLTDEKSIQKTAKLTAQGISLALSSPSFRKELGKYLVEPWSKNRRGISVDSLYIPRFIAILEPFLLPLGVGLKEEAKFEGKRWLSSSAVIYIATLGDMPEYWFRAGRAYLQVSLHIERLGLSQATSAALVEASNFHEDIEEMLETTHRLQSVIRIGKGSKHRAYSPRVDAETLLTT